MVWFLKILPDHQLFCDLLEACKLSQDIRTATETHTRIIRFGYGTNSSIAASLISTYVNCNQLNLAYQVIRQVFSWTVSLAGLNLVIDSFMRIGEYEIAKKVFCKMPDRDVVTWNSMIGGYVRNGKFEEALRSFQAMLSSNVEPDKFTFASVITACARLGALNHAQWLHDLMVQKRIEVNFILSSALIDMYSKCGRIETAKEVFESVERNDVSVWNSLINGLAVHGLALDAMMVFSKMEAENVLPDSLTFLGILKACSHCGLVKEGRKYFDLMENYYSIKPQLEHYGAMVDLLGRAGLLDEAYAMITAMPMEPDVIVWRILLSACRTHRNTELGEVAVANISGPKSGDYVLLSNIYCSQNRWDNAQEVREMMKEEGVRKRRGKSWFEWEDVVHRFRAGDKSHPETEALYKILEGLIQRTKLEGFVPSTELVMMDVSEEEKEENLYHHSEKLALAYGILKTSPGTEIRIYKNLRICYDCHNWIKMVSGLLSRVIIIRDRIRFHRFEGGSCSCGDYW
uniref:JHL07K02.11 protein n=1 Tax=Jatropha curcas TaxID=180498 RepID=E6NU11_JATCU|nr:JHL07K02.11 [Jatropha curcas]